MATPVFAPARGHKRSIDRKSAPVERAPALDGFRAGRIPPLDGVRALASVMVLAYHFGPHIVRSANSSFAALLRVPRKGVEGVDLFFVVSGFLISRTLADARRSPNYFSTFYIRRVFRIFPLYFLVLAGYTLTAWWAGSRAPGFGRLFENPLPIWTYYLYIQNFAMSIAGSYGAIWMAGTWSLAIEEQFYLAVPAIVKLVSDRVLFRLAAIGFLGPPLLRAIEQKTRILPVLSNSVLLPMRVDALSAGILAMLLLRNHRAALENSRRALRRLGIAAAIAWLAFPCLPPGISARMEFLDHTVCSLTFGLLLLNLLIARCGRISSALSSRPLRWLGNTAYSMYLLHPILLCVAFRLMRGADPRLDGLSDLAPLAAALTATLLLSWASWSWVEQPMLAYAKRFRY